MFNHISLFPWQTTGITKGEYFLETLYGSNIDNIIDSVSHDKGASDSVADVCLVLEVIDEYVTHLFSSSPIQQSLLEIKSTELLSWRNG